MSIENKNNPISTQPITTNQNKNNIIPTTTKHYTKNIQPKQNIIDTIKIVTHNVQGLNDKLKMQIWLEFCYKNEYTIISMTETKLAESTQTKFKLSNPYYNIYTSNCTIETAKKQESSMGTAIAILKPLQPYIHNIQTCAGTAIAIDLFFPQNQKVRVISVYLPSNNKTLNKQAQTEISNWINFSNSHNYNTIILGDFNFDRKKNKAQTAPYIFSAMQAQSITSLLYYFDNNEPTWTRGDMSSQIDDIWVSNSLIS